MRRMAVLGIAAALLQTDAAAAGYEYNMALYSDAACASCNVRIPMGETRDIFIVLDTNDPQGVGGAGLRVAGLPAGWAYVVTPSPASNVSIGDPMGMGSAIGFPTSIGAVACFLLYRVAVTATTVASDVTLSIVAPLWEPPSTIPEACPYVAVSDTDFDAGIVGGSPRIARWFRCADTRPMWINSNKDCVVATTPASWSAIKSIYGH